MRVKIAGIEAYLRSLVLIEEREELEDEEEDVDAREE